MAIAVGDSCIDRPSSTVIQNSQWTLANPCSGDGTITTVDIWVVTAGHFKVAMVYDLGNGVWGCRSVADFGALPSGHNTLGGLTLDARAGDCLAYWSDDGTIEATTGQGSTVLRRSYPLDWLTTGLVCAAVSTTGWSISLYGSGTDYVTPPNEQEIYDGMDDVRDNYMPGVNAWIDDNWQGLTQFTLVLASFFKLANDIANGGSGSGLTLTQLQDELDTRFGTLAVNLATEIESLHYELGVNNSPATGLLAAIEEVDFNTNSEIAQAVSDLRYEIQAADHGAPPTAAAIAAEVNAAHPDDVTDAVTTISGEIDEAVATIRGIPATDLATILANITSPEIDFTSVLDAIASAVTTIDGVTVAQIADVLEAIAAITASASAPVYPGSGNITTGSPQAITGPTVITTPMDGIQWQVNTAPPGQSRQQVGSRSRYKGIGWFAFVNDSGKLEERQSLELDLGLATPHSMTRASAVVIFVKSGASVTVTPYTNNA